MKIEEINTVCFVGAGTMGCFNALMAAVAGYQAVIYDISSAALDHAPQVLREMAGFLVGEKFFAADAIPAALSRITFSADVKDATSKAELVSESASERLEIKRDVHRQLDQVCQSTTLITTNTSSLLVSDIEDVLEHGDRFAALHSHLGSTLIDIVGGPRTSLANVELLKRYVLSINGTPLVLNKENPGYVLNAMLGPLLTMAKILVIEGLASKEDVDRAWMLHQQASIGPFGLMDLFGLNVVFDSWQKPNRQNAHLRDKVLGLISPYIDKNALGVKTGSGFYDYPDPDYQRADFLAGDADLSFVYSVLLTALIENAVVIARNGIADPQDIDRAWTVSFSVASGPFAILDEMGVDNFLEAYAGLVASGLFLAETALLVEDYLRLAPGINWTPINPGALAKSL